MKESFLLGLNWLLVVSIVLFVICSIIILVAIVVWEMQIIIEVLKVLHGLIKEKILMYKNRGRKKCQIQNQKQN